MGGGREHIGRWWGSTYQITVLSVRLEKFCKEFNTKKRAGDGGGLSVEGEYV